MRVIADPQALRQTTLGQVGVRFALGGLVTAAAGMIATKWGPVVGGLFLAFPAICPASLTLVGKHEQDNKEADGEDGKQSGIDDAAVDAAGAAIGSIGLVAFAGVVWGLADATPSWATLLLATIAWAAVSGVGWVIRQLA